MKKRIYLLLGLCLALAVFLPNTAKEVQAADGVLGDLTGDSAVTTDDKTAFEEYLLGIENETTTTNLAYANVNGVEDETAGAMTDVRDLVRYERYLYLKDAAESCTNEEYVLSGTAGTNKDIWYINNVKDLYCFALKSIGTDTDGKTVYYYNDYIAKGTNPDTIYLADNIEINVGTGEPSTWDGSQQLLYPWTPVGNSSVQLTEIIDGQGYAISGLYFNDTNTNYVGFVGFSNNSNAAIRNLAIKNSCFKGKNYVASVAGVMSGNCSNLYSDACVVSNSYTGGILGSMFNTAKQTVKNCWFAGQINASGNYVGGIVGGIQYNATLSNETAITNQKSIISCLYTGDIVGTSTGRTGLVGGLLGCSTPYVQTVLLQDCLAIGSVSTISDQGVAAIAGRIGTPTTSLTVEDVYSACTMTCTSETYTWNSNTTLHGVGQKVTYDETNEKWVASAKGALEGVNIWTDNESYLIGYGGYRLTQLPFVDGRTEYDVDDTTQSTATWIAVENSYPILENWKDISCFADGEAYATLTLDSTMTAKASIDWYLDNPNSSSSLYTLSDEEDLWGFSFLANTNDVDFQGKIIELKQDITLDSGENWTPLYQDIKGADVGFKGKFDGNGYSISGLTINSNVADVGFFAEMKSGSELYELKMQNATITSSDGVAYIGSFAGRCGGNIYNVYSDATIVTDGANCGGIAGILSGSATHKIENAWFAGNITTNKAYCGGIVGRITMGADTAGKYLTRCINSGVITYTGSSTISKYIGGICGGVHAIGGNDLDAVFENVLALGVVQTTNTMGVGSVVGCVQNASGKTTTLTLAGAYTTDVVKCLVDTEYVQLTGDDLNALYTSPIWGIGKGGDGTINEGYVIGRLDGVGEITNYAQQIPNSDFTWSVSDDDVDGINTVTYTAVDATE